MDAGRDAQAELRVLRERVAQLESAMAARSDPLQVALLENSASFLNVVTPDGRFMATGRVSPAFGSVVGRSILEFTAPSSHATVRDALERVCNTGLPSNYEVDAFGEHGEPDHVYQVRAVPLKTDGVVNAIVLIPTDVTTRVRLERSLRETAESLRLAADATGMGFWRWDIGSNSLTWDSRMLDLFGVEQVPSSYAAYQALIHPDDRSLVDGAVRQALEGGTYPTNEHRIIRQRDATERWVLGAAQVTRDEAGRPMFLQGGALDITERKQLAQQLEQAQRVQAVGQLAAGIAHNFNNLLAVILPSLSLAVNEQAESAPEALRAALTAAEQARELVMSMFALSVGDVETPGRADVVEVVTRTVNMCRATFPRQIEINATLTLLPGSVRLSNSGLEQVLLNLLTNARDAFDASPERQLRIDIELQHVPSALATLPQAGKAIAANNLGSARLTVTDNGAGMHDDVRRRIFDPFFSTKRRQRGAGLGLATVLARVRDAGGTIDCTSQLGVGTTFSVVLPLDPALREQSPARTTPLRSRLHGRVLVVDDEALVRTAVRRVLERAGLSVDEAGTTADARALLEQSSVDLLILDHSMPFESGVAALPSLRARTRAPIVLFSGHIPEQPSGVALILKKPATPDELLTAVEQALGPYDASRLGAMEPTTPFTNEP